MQNQKGNTKVIVSFIIVLCVIAFIVYAMMNKKADAPENVIDQNIAKAEVNSEPTNSVANTDTLKKIDLVVGTGAEVAPGATVSVHYTGAVAATGEVFQSSKDFGDTPITFPLSGVIKGWTDGIPGMKIGGTRRLVIPAAQAYGVNPPANSGIPANADLVFDVELIAVK